MSFCQGVTKSIGKGMHEWAAKVDEYARGLMGPAGATLFEELGLYYIGPVDGHSIEDLICVLQQVASLDSTGPVLVHVVTEGKWSMENSESSEVTSNQWKGIFASLMISFLVYSYYLLNKFSDKNITHQKHTHELIIDIPVSKG